MQFEYVNGAQIIFRGLDDALKLKSIKPKKKAVLPLFGLKSFQNYRGNCYCVPSNSL